MLLLWLNVAVSVLLQNEAFSLEFLPAEEEFFFRLLPSPCSSFAGYH